LKKDLPEDVTVEMVYDNTRFIRASIAEVEETIYVAFLLVVLIIFLFLRDWRVTLSRWSLSPYHWSGHSL